jgi:hypothetical protein
MYVINNEINDSDTFFRKNVPDYSAGREKNDLGFVVFDMQADILLKKKYIIQ